MSPSSEMAVAPRRRASLRASRNGPSSPGRRPTWQSAKTALIAGKDSPRAVFGRPHARPRDFFGAPDCILLVKRRFFGGGLALPRFTPPVPLLLPSASNPSRHPPPPLSPEGAPKAGGRPPPRPDRGAHG